MVSLGYLPSRWSPSSALLPTEPPFLPEQLTPASASYSYDYDPVPPDSGHLAASHGHEVMDLEGEAEDR